MRQKCKAVSWADGAACEALSVTVASGRWKVSSGGILRLKRSARDGDQNQQCYRKPGPGADQPSGFPRTLPALAQKIPNPRKSLGSGQTVLMGHPTFPSPVKGNRIKLLPRYCLELGIYGKQQTQEQESKGRKTNNTTANDLRYQLV